VTWRVAQHVNSRATPFPNRAALYSASVKIRGTHWKCIGNSGAMHFIRTFNRLITPIHSGYFSANKGTRFV